MKTRMFLTQRRMNEVILYCILIDIVLAYVLKRFHGPQTVLPLAILYLLNIIVLLGVYRFWKFPLLEWDDTGFALYGLSPFKKDICKWDAVKAAGIKRVETGKGRVQEFLMIIYPNPRGGFKTGTVLMGSVGFADRIKPDFLAFIKKKGIKPL